MRWNAIKYLFTLILPSLVMGSFYLKDYWVWIPVLYAFGLVPFIELWMKPDKGNLTKAEEAILKEDRIYDYIVYAMVPLQYGILIYFLKIWRNHEVLTLMEMGGLIASMGIMCGTYGINVGHELGHRKKTYERFLAKTSLMSSLYMHFFIEHNRGHHKRVATDEDPASSRRGESVYAFWLRSVSMSYASAWKLESSRLKNRKRAVFSWENEMIRMHVIQLLLLTVIFWVWGTVALLAFLGAAAVGILLLETVNYIEHYGLRRDQLESNRYERVQVVHSWNSNHFLGRLMLFELSRHSDHHYVASRKYQILRHHEQSPQMPTGYPGMMLISLIPPLWFMIMDREIDKQKKTGLPTEPVF